MKAANPRGVYLGTAGVMITLFIGEVCGFFDFIYNPDLIIILLVSFYFIATIIHRLFIRSNDLKESRAVIE